MDFKKTLVELALSAGILGLGVKKADAATMIDLPYTQNFESAQIGSNASDLEFYKPAIVYGGDFTPFGKSVSLDSKYAFVTGWGGQSTFFLLPEINDTLNFSCDFMSIPNGDANAGFKFSFAATYVHPRTPRMGLGVNIPRDMDLENVTASFKPEYMGFIDNINHPIAEQLGTLEDYEPYHLNLSIKKGLFDLTLTGEDTNISYSWDLGVTFPVDSIQIWHGTAPDYAHGVAIDNIRITPEPATIGLLGLGGLALLLKKKKP